MKVWNRKRGNYAARILALLLIIAVALQNVSGTGLSTVAEAAETKREEQADILKKYGIVAEGKMSSCSVMKQTLTQTYIQETILCVPEQR